MRRETAPAETAVTLERTPLVHEYESILPQRDAVAAQRRRYWLWLLLAALLLALLFALQVRNWWHPTPDAVAYLSIARSVWSGQGLSNLGSRQLHYAPGFPLLASPVFLSALHPILLLSLLRLGVALAALAGVYVWARRLVSPLGALALVVMAGCNVSFWQYYRTPLSDLPMMMWFFWAGVALQRLALARSRGAVIGWCLLAMVLVAAAAVTRQAAIAVGGGLAAALIQMAIQKKIGWGRAQVTLAVIVVPAVLLLAGLALYDQAMAPLGVGHTYFDEIRPTAVPLWQQLLQGLHLRISEAGRLLIPGMWNTYSRPEHWLDQNLLLYLPVAALLAGGWWMLVKRSTDALVLAVPFYLGIYLLWPFDQDTRFLMPVLPLLLICLWPWWRHVRRWRGGLIAAFCGAHLLVACLQWVMEIRHDGREYADTWPQLVTLSQAADFSHEQTAARGLTPNARLWFTFLIDRRVRVLRAGDAVPDEVAWLIEPRNAEAQSNFDVVSATAGLRASHRRRASASEPAVVDYSRNRYHRFGIYPQWPYSELHPRRSSS